MTRRQLVDRLERAWRTFVESYAGLTDAQLLEPGVTKAWSVRDIIAHVTWWEEEALTHLPLVRRGETPPRYSVTHGGIDAFNARMTEQKKALTLAEVFAEQADTHRRLLDYLHQVPEELLTSETRFRHRLRLDTYGHYPKHTKAIVSWRERAAIPAAPPAEPRK